MLGIFSGPYQLIAKIGAALLVVATIVGLILLYGNSRYNSGVSDTDEKWAKASAKVEKKIQEATKIADNNAIKRVEVYTDMVREEKEKLDEAYSNNTSSFDVLFPVSGSNGSNGM